jgi:hypothetical protein
MGKFLTIHRNEDEPYLEILSREELEHRLNGEWAKLLIITTIPTSLMVFPSHSLFIFKGEITTPKPVQVATKWEI